MKIVEPNLLKVDENLITSSIFHDNPTWAVATDYVTNDLVNYNDGGGLKAYRCIFPHTSSATFTASYWKLDTDLADWSSSILYDTYDTVIGSDKHLYESIQPTNLNNDPTSSPAFWKDYGAVFTPENTNSFPTWSVGILYYQGDLIVYSGKLYRAIEDNSDKQPDVYTEDFWRDYGTFDNSTGNAWVSGSTYNVDDLVSHESGYKKFIYRCIATHKPSGTYSTFTLGNKYNIGTELERTYTTNGVSVTNVFRVISSKYNTTDGVATTSYPEADTENWQISQGVGDKKPSENVNTYWTQLGAINLYRCMSDRTNNKTERQNYLKIRTKTLKGDYISLVGMRATHARITVFDSSGSPIAYADSNAKLTATDTANNTHVTGSLQYKDATSWNEYFFKDFSYRTDYSVSIPTASFNEVEVELFFNGNVARLGRFVAGRSFYIGDTLYGASTGILDFSLKERDETFGDTYLRQGNYAKRTDLEVLITSGRMDAVMQFLTYIRGKEVLLDANSGDTATTETYDNLVIYGFVKDFDILLENPAKSMLSLEFEGLI